MKNTQFIFAVYNLFSLHCYIHSNTVQLILNPLCTEINRQASMSVHFTNNTSMSSSYNRKLTQKDTHTHARTHIHTHTVFPLSICMFLFSCYVPMITSISASDTEIHFFLYISSHANIYTHNYVYTDPILSFLPTTNASLSSNLLCLHVLWHILIFTLFSFCDLMSRSPEKLLNKAYKLPTQVTASVNINHTPSLYRPQKWTFLKIAIPECHLTTSKIRPIYVPCYQQINQMFNSLSFLSDRLQLVFCLGIVF